MALCYECNEYVSSDDAIGCSACQKWAHKKCAHMNSLNKKDVPRINWVCTPCLDKLKFYLLQGESINQKFDKYHKSIEEKLEDVDSKVKQVLTEVEKNAGKSSSSSSSPSASSPPPSSYAKALKKHLLVVKSTDNAQKATERKDEISDVLKGLQIVDAQFKQTGNVILNFESEKSRDEAATKVGGLDNLSATKTKKLFPKIMICNVSAEESKEEILETIIEKNDYLKSIDDVMGKMRLSFVKEAAGNTKHYILKCHPEVRAAIYKKRDKIKLEWGVYKIFCHTMLSLSKLWSHT